MKYRIARTIGLSSNGKAIVDVNVITRRVSVAPLHPTSKETLDSSFGCGLVGCLYPDRTCKDCDMNVEHQYIKAKGI